ncbi:hypothetical protein SAMN06269117_11469 [Balnearium lithotrophicum]|uniref:Uncharacterized protein n=1 Tax=Balnearium lithotrophicum TaxID=223788 RepID=A0A521CRC6_9BACT|nr:hypothetical protein [Balnearium lithotrophicum]SMO62029.1 hypothetical protein SAMN06269117_11469 [Balnearium lithotrophicum]
MEFPFTPSYESLSKLKGIKGDWGDKFKVSLNFSFSGTQKNDFLLFHSKNSFNNFDYYLKNKTVGQGIRSSFKAKDVDAVVSIKDGATLWVNESISEISVNAGSADQTLNVSLSPMGTLRIAMEYVGEEEYLYIVEGDNLLIISIQNDTLMMSLKTTNSSSAVGISVKDLYDGGDLGKVISFSVGYDLEKFTLSHGGHTKSIENNAIDMANATVQCLQNTYDFIIFDTEFPDRILQILNQPLTDSVSISVNEPDISISEAVPTFVYGRLGVTATFLTKEVKFTPEGDVFKTKIDLTEV